MSRRENRAKELKRYGVNKLVEDYIDLENNYSELKKEQKEFQEQLTKEIDKIKAMKGFNRFWASLKLLWSLINTIEQGFKNKV
jgi:hypothetical protein